MILIDNRNSSDPYVNLAIEEYLVRNADCKGKDYLLFYVNEPCVVIGKNQSIYKEVNFEYLRNGKLKMARRITGGGAVYHDRGNLSFSFISAFADDKVNNYKHFNQPVVNALRKAGIAAAMDARNNILCQDKKISGNAQFTDRKNIISHGTLLLNADLLVLRASLKENDFTVQTKAVSSVRSPVMNISEVSSRFLSAGDLIKYLADELNVKDIYNFTAAEWKAIRQLAGEKFSSFDWIYGRSPNTKIIKEEMEIEVEEGTIKQIGDQKTLHPRQGTQGLVGLRYEFESIKKVVGESFALKIF